MSAVILRNGNGDPVLVTDNPRLADLAHVSSSYEMLVFLLTARTEAEASLICAGAEATFLGTEWQVVFTGRYDGLWSVKPVNL